jgi:hypothetical protein
MIIDSSVVLRRRFGPAKMHSNRARHKNAAGRNAQSERHSSPIGLEQYVEYQSK